MKIIIPKISGFCYGVSLAIKSAQNIVDNGEKLLMYGEIVHNSHVVNEFVSRGARVIEAVSDITEEDKNNKSCVLVRAHGVSLAVLRELEATGVKIVDSTCPKVKKVHEIVSKESDMGKSIIIIGNENHPEVKGIVGWCKNGCTVLSDYKAVCDYEFDINREYCVVAQTTFNIVEFKNISEYLAEKYKNIEIINTICPATDTRQKLINEFSSQCDLAIVVGGKHSSNSKKLWMVASRNCESVLIEDASELDLELVANRDKILICAGSSTPINLVNRVAECILERFDGEIEYK